MLRRTHLECGGHVGQGFAGGQVSSWVGEGHDTEVRVQGRFHSMRDATCQLYE